MTSANAVRRLRSTIPARRHTERTPSFAVAAAVAVGALAAMALVNRHLAEKAERDNPAAGRFLHVNGVRLHYIERGSGEPLVLLHGNGSMIEDFESSGLIDLAAAPLDHVFGNARLRHLKPKLEQFPMDTWRAPKRIFHAHPPDQDAQLRFDLRSPSQWARLPTPVAAKTGPMPTDQLLGPDDRENLQD
jgi:hypothetical protein